MKNQIVILSTADFDSPVWTNKQHLAKGLSENHNVVYIESLGLREPTFSVADLGRIFTKALQFVKKRSGGGQEEITSTSKKIQIISPLLIPFHKFAAVRRLNRRLLKQQLSSVLGGAANSTLWTFSPLTYGLADLFGHVVYHSVDLLHTLPKVPGSLLLMEEKQLIDKADHVIASSMGVKRHLEQLGSNGVMLWENVAHVQMFNAAIQGERRDQAVFAGNITPAKIDLACLKSILDHGMSLALAGPMDIDGSGSSSMLTDFMKHPSVTYHGNLALPELAKLMAESKVGLIPYQINAYTRGVFPMKVYEYLAAGLSVVSTHLPSFGSAPIQNLSLVSQDQFGVSVKNAILSHDETTVEVSVNEARGHSWEARILQANALILEGGCKQFD